MSDVRYTVKRLNDDVVRHHCTPLQAQARIIEVRDLLNDLLQPMPDARRCLIVKKLRRRLAWGFANIEDLGAVGKIASRLVNVHG